MTIDSKFQLLFQFLLSEIEILSCQIMGLLDTKLFSLFFAAVASKTPVPHVPRRRSDSTWTNKARGAFVPLIYVDVLKSDEDDVERRARCTCWGGERLMRLESSSSRSARMGH